MTPDTTKQRIAHWVRQSPLLWAVLQIAYRATQPRFTLGVLGVVFSPVGRILVVEHVYHPKTPWGFPGGWLGRREHPHEGVIREVREETSLSITIINPILVMISPYHRRHLDTAFLCRAETETVHLSEELLDHRWLPPAEALNVPMTIFHKASLRAALAAAPTAAPTTEETTHLSP
ncbi:MAG TPA: NUDIX hydrolase [Aggregatilineales bacterium]|nr:NUDIX hydrolase [Anaerolineales bacterium]HRE49609.1 NUDIX hydrolase [Aggregatilineales bacterium]